MPKQEKKTQPTLFSYYKKVPAASPCITPIKGANATINVMDVVWAKLNTYPYWPALVCGDPRTNKHKAGNKIHVQFFDRPPSRAWVNRDLVIRYGGEDKDKRDVKNCINLHEWKNLQIAMRDADEALPLSTVERENLLVEFSVEEDKENGDSPTSSGKQVKMDYDSDDSADEFKPDKNDTSSSDGDNNSNDDDSDDDDGKNRGKKRKNRGSMKTPSAKKAKPATAESTPKARASLFSAPTTPSVSGTPRRLSSNTAHKLSSFKSPAPSANSSSSTGQREGSWPHLQLSFIQPDKIMDSKKRKSDHPEYDSSTLFVPEDFKNTCTPGMRQWWELKASHWDTVLFFKVGKFYELYHMDALIGVDELSLSLMRGDHAHSGFPEIAYGRFSTILVQKGYKVARVEQMETPEMMAERCKNMKCTKFDKVVQREVCQVTSKGTISHSVMEGEAREPNSHYLLALTEKEGSYGVCFIDVSIGVFHIGQFQDDKYVSRMRTLLSQCAPAEVIYEKRDVSERTLQLLNSLLLGVAKRPLHSDTEFWSASKTLNSLANREELRSSDGSVKWPDGIRHFISPNDPLGLTPSENGDLALRALGACVRYLERSFLATQLLSMKQFQIYDPIDGNNSLKGHHLILDDITLTNLEVLKNSRGGTEGTLLGRVDRCSTFFGKRLLRQWLCAPLADPAAIRDRQDAIEELLERSTLTQDLRKLLKNVPDLERNMAKIHAQGLSTKNHPDNRAIFYEAKIYSKRKIQDFLTTLSGFDQVDKIIKLLQKEQPAAKVLLACTNCADLRPQLAYFENAFDHEHARAEGRIIPKTAGVDADYDNATDELHNMEKERETYLKQQSVFFGAQVKYFGTDKNRYQLEVAEGPAKKANSDYEFTSARKGYKRFMTKDTKEFLNRQTKAEEAQRAALRDLCRRIFSQLDDNYDDWIKAVDCVAKLDVLISLSEYIRCEGDTCIPEFVDSWDKPFIDIDSGRHPCIPVTDGFIPNSVMLGNDDWRSLVLLTGPNMGGKSTLLRQLGLHVIMAHMGCRLPAASARLTPVDRVFTRIGAGDDIIAGESTFFQELSETGLIIQHATARSVVLVDELGRGTSTYDGTAIAHAVVAELARRGCLTLFSTHYHSLVDELQSATERVSLGHMACATDGDAITFLYQFSKGACPSSHGFHAARLAGLPETIIHAGQEKAQLLARENTIRKLFRELCLNEVDGIGDYSKAGIGHRSRLIMKRHVTTLPISEEERERLQRRGVHYHRGNQPISVSPVPIIFGVDLVADASGLPILHSGLSKAMGGRFPRKSICIVSGAPWVGKTSLCMQMCCDVQIPEECGGAGGQAVYICTDASFTLQRLREISEETATLIPAGRLHQKSMLSGVYVSYIEGIRKLSDTLDALPDFLKSHRHVKLVVVDSFSLPYLCGEPDTLKRTTAVHEALTKLENVARVYDLTVLLTIQLTTALGADANPSRIIPCLGEGLRHRVQLHLMLQENKVIVLQSSSRPRVSVGFSLSEHGGGLS